MKRRIIDWRWEDSESQASFLRWKKIPGSEASCQEVSQIEVLTGIKPPLKILDVGCGTGRHAIEFAKRGYTVKGIDIANGYLEIAAENAGREGEAIEFALQRGAQITERGI
jgi:2-polyprenyl-3-methyl-5-hydroxy-6-metoxy-1,4-benzoquinol methylase